MSYECSLKNTKQIEKIFFIKKNLVHEYSLKYKNENLHLPEANLA